MPMWLAYNSAAAGAARLGTCGPPRRPWVDARGSVMKKFALVAFVVALRSVLTDELEQTAGLARCLVEQR